METTSKGSRVSRCPGGTRVKLYLVVAMVLCNAGSSLGKSCTCSGPQYVYNPATNKCIGDCAAGYQRVDNEGRAYCVSCPEGSHLTEGGKCQSTDCSQGYTNEGGKCKQACPPGYEAAFIADGYGGTKEVCAESCVYPLDIYHCSGGPSGTRTRTMYPRVVSAGTLVEPLAQELPQEEPACMCEGGVEHVVSQGDTLMKVAAKYGSSPYTLRVHNSHVKEPNPEAQLPVKFKLMVCPEDTRFRKDGGRLVHCLDKYPRPCATYQGQEQENCFCAYQEDGDHKWPFDDNGGKCDVYVTCKHWKSEGLKHCSQGQQTLEANQRTSEDPKSRICGEATVPCTKESCLDSSCFCRQFLLPPGTYSDPFDSARRLTFICTDQIETHWDTPSCTEIAPFFDPGTQQCGRTRKCRESLRTYGGCKLTDLVAVLKEVLPLEDECPACPTCPTCPVCDVKAPSPMYSPSPALTMYTEAAAPPPTAITTQSYLVTRTSGRRRNLLAPEGTNTQGSSPLCQGDRRGLECCGETELLKAARDQLQC